MAGGVSDETGQAATDKTCKDASLSPWAPFPGRLPENRQSLALGPPPAGKGLWAAAIALSVCGSFKQHRNSPKGLFEVTWEVLSVIWTWRSKVERYLAASLWTQTHGILWPPPLGGGAGLQGRGVSAL